jgi:chromosome segregation ATPase
METGINAHLLTYLIDKLIKHDFHEQIEIKMFKSAHPGWNEKKETYHFGYGQFGQESLYRIKLETIFKHKSPNQIIEAFIDSKMSKTLVNEIKQYFMAHTSLGQTDSILKMVSDVSNDMSRSLRKQKKYKKAFEEEFQTIRDNTDSITNDLKDVRTDIDSHNSTLYNLQLKLTNHEKILIRLEDKIDKIDDKFNLLTDFIDMMAGSKPQS